jgi:ABC-type lipoprotein release transport system permease subunit
MGRILLVGRLALRDLRHRRTEAVLLLLGITAATTTLTLGLVLRDAASNPYESTRQATAGPDVVAAVDQRAGRRALEDLATFPEVTDHGGPYLVAPAELHAAGHTSDAQVVGRDTARESVDQPAQLHGTWVRDGGAVVEAAFAAALEVQVGDSIALDERSFEVVGIAATAAMAPFPRSTCLVPQGCVSGATPEMLSQLPPTVLQDPGLVWLTETDVQSLATDANSLAYVMNLRLAHPDDARAFVDSRLAENRDAPLLRSWEDIRDEATELAADAQILLMIGAWLLGLLAVASVSVLVGGRMAAQTRRVGLLKAVGGTPGLIAAVLLAQYIVVALAAAAAGLVVGSLTAPFLTETTAGLVGTAAVPPITVSTVGLVTAVAVGVAVAATAVPAVRAARSSTVRALADAARPPRRTGWLISVSARVPTPLLIALRVAARRPRRALLGAVSVAIAVSGIFVALVLDQFLTTQASAAGYRETQVDLLRRVLLVVMLILLALAAVNAVVLTWATVLDNRHSSALVRALGATSRDVSVAVATTQVLPALGGAVVGVLLGGPALFAAIMVITGGDSDRATLPPWWQLAALVAGTVLLVAALTAVPARLAGRRPVTATLGAELA